MFCSYLSIDIMKKEMVNAGCAETLVHVIASCKGREEEESMKYRLETAADMIVTILTDGEFESPKNEQYQI